MNKCPKCGTEFEGKFCPECGSSPTGERLCPNCKALVPSDAKFCKECGFTLTPQVQPPVKKRRNNAAAVWIKAHKKLLGWGAAALVLVLILSIVIPVAVINRHNGTYYLYENEQYNYEKYFILKGNTYTDESGYSCDVDFDGSNVSLYAELFGIKDVIASGTIKDGVLRVEDALGAKRVYAKKGAMHEHEFGDWTVQTASTCTKYGVEVRACKGCEKTETRSITKLAEHQGTWEVTKEATCTETGLREKHCSVCGQDIIEKIDKTDHLGNWKVIKKATCTETGLREKHCSVCGQDFSETIDKLPHTLLWEFDKTTHWQRCSVCSQTFAPEESTHQNSTEKQCDICGYEYGSTIGLAYSIGKDRCVVTGLGTATDTEIVIPSQYNGKPVTTIGYGAFEDCSGLTSVTIPDSVTSIGDYAFEDCSGLTSITIPDRVTSIGDEAFYGCSGLTSVTIPNSVTKMGDGAFRNCSGLTSVTIPDSVTEIGDYAFEDCSRLISVTIPDSVTEIERFAFSNCSGLTSITIPDSVTEIEVAAFAACRKLVEVWNYSVLDIQAGKSDFGSIGYYAKHVYTENIPSKQTVVDDYIFYEEGEESYLLGYKGAETQLTFPAKSPTGKKYAIYQFAFSGCSGLTSIAIPDSVTEIGDSAFSGCSGLTGELKIPDGVTEIGDYAFYWCVGLTSVTIPDSVIEIGDYAFYWCAELTSVTIPNSVTLIGKYAFYLCGLNEVYFENPNGWKVSEYSDMRDAKTVSGLEDPAQAAEYLTHTYNWYYWKREG